MDALALADYPTRDRHVVVTAGAALLSVAAAYLVVQQPALVNFEGVASARGLTLLLAGLALGAVCLRFPDVALCCLVAFVCLNVSDVLTRHRLPSLLQVVFVPLALAGWWHAPRATVRHPRAHDPAVGLPGGRSLVDDLRRRSTGGGCATARASARYRDLRCRGDAGAIRARASPGGVDAGVLRSAAERAGPCPDPDRRLHPRLRRACAVRVRADLRHDLRAAHRGTPWRSELLRTDVADVGADRADPRMDCGRASACARVRRGGPGEHRHGVHLFSGRRAGTECGHRPVAVARGVGLRKMSLAFVALLVVLATAVPGEFTRRLTTLSQLLPGSDDVLRPDSSFGERKMFTASAWRMFEDYPLAGVGAGNYGAHFSSAQRSARTRALMSLRQKATTPITCISRLPPKRDYPASLLSLSALPRASSTCGGAGRPAGFAETCRRRPRDRVFDSARRLSSHQRISPRRLHPLLVAAGRFRGPRRIESRPPVERLSNDKFRTRRLEQRAASAKGQRPPRVIAHGTALPTSGRRSR